MKLRAAALLLLLPACAHIEPPPGGPEDLTPPIVVATRPDTLAVVPGFTGPAAFVFDSRVAGENVADAVLISPLTSAPDVDRRGSEIRVGLRRGWEPGRIYQITVLPGIQDVSNNRTREPVTLVFSTGPPIPDTRLTGIVTDRITGRTEAGLRVEAIPQGDTLGYATVSDSAGAFVFTRIPSGAYQLRAYRDLNRNRLAEPYEPRDSAAATVTAGAAGAPSVRLAVLAPDSTAPRAASAQLAGTSVQIQFDDYLDPTQAVTPAQVRITGPGGQLVAVTRARIGQLEAAAPDSAAAPGAAPFALPSQTLSVQPAAALAPQAEYRIRIDGVRNLHGLVGGGEVVLKTPAAAPPAP